MGQGIQQPPVQQSGGSSLLDVLKVLYEPSAVFERVREKPSFLVPYLVICVVQIAVYFVNMPFLKAGMAAQMASRPAGGPDPSKFLWIGAVFIPVGFAIGLLIGAGLLWVLVSVFRARPRSARTRSQRVRRSGAEIDQSLQHLGTRADGDWCLDDAPPVQANGLHGRDGWIFDRRDHRRRRGRGLQTVARVRLTTPASSRAAWAAARRAIGTRKGEQDT
ncbi:MAG: hypothetical protein DMD48_15485 [Gemmatimonadetes bacterium]|nr:MAG: hypothetical protein DMD48_15485 [Gemmatimonadota bacterium]